MKFVTMPMAPSAECDQVFLDIVTEQTAGTNVVHLKVARTAATLATPAIAV